MRKNVIILTSGLSGSSVLTGLLARAGYWTGDSTFKKSDYDTYENEALVGLHTRLFADAKYTGNYMMEFSAEGIKQVEASFEEVDKAPFLALLEECNKHRPWVWKDPRLWLTIRFWVHLLNLEECSFIVLKRDYGQAWISATLRRQVQSYGYLKGYLRGVNDSVVSFLNQHKQPYLEMSYEDLIIRPTETINRLNAFLDVSLSLDDLRKVYTKPLYEYPRSFLDLVKAVLIYVKNYPERYRTS